MKDEYAEQGLRFMRNNNTRNSKNREIELIFPELRLLPFCAKEMNKKIKPFYNAVWYINRFIKHDEIKGKWVYYNVKNPFFTHLWLKKSDKNQSRKNIRELIKIIRKDYFDYYNFLLNNPLTKHLMQK
ncbi:MAG: hypothetical protein A2355_09235 [Spirochaetes bacterium RIFOXYB1_FULL_32_8]|nr:MAG: hypothetical protein A2355_09235 [Spirochaetes bacterium RIFOXYB1_FULL_32_8]